jgi:hypothetical protein
MSEQESVMYYSPRFVPRLTRWGRKLYLESGDALKRKIVTTALIIHNGH